MTTEVTAKKKSSGIWQQVLYTYQAPDLVDFERLSTTGISYLPVKKNLRSKFLSFIFNATNTNNKTVYLITALTFMAVMGFFLSLANGLEAVSFAKLEAVPSLLFALVAVYGLHFVCTSKLMRFKKQSVCDVSFPIVAVLSPSLQAYKMASKENKQFLQESFTSLRFACVDLCRLKELAKSSNVVSDVMLEETNTAFNILNRDVQYLVQAILQHQDVFSSSDAARAGEVSAIYQRAQGVNAAARASKELLSGL